MLNSRTRAALLRKIERYSSRVLSRDEALAVLVREGTHNPHGSITPEYGGPPTRTESALPPDPARPV